MSLQHVAKVVSELVTKREAAENKTERKIQKQLAFESPKVVFMLCAKRESYVSKLLREVAKSFDNVSVEVAKTPKEFRPILDEAIATGTKLYCAVDIDRSFIENKNMMRLFARHCLEVYAFHWPRYAIFEHEIKIIEEDVKEGRWNYFEKLTLRQAQKANKEKRPAFIQETVRDIFTRLLYEVA